jgi:hypothetical protein
VQLSVTLLETREGPEFVVKFAIEQVLSRRAADFEGDLLYNLNLLQENVGAVDVFPSAASLADYLATVRVDWEILPPGDLGGVLRAVFRGVDRVDPKVRAEIEHRVNVISRLKPEALIAGTSGFSRYFGAKFADDLVVFENVRYGNALYVMYERWEELNRRSRVDLLKGPRDGFDRIEHRAEWEDRLAALLDRQRKQRKKGK